MRFLPFFLALLLFALPAFAAVTGTFVDPPNVNPQDAFDIKLMGGYHSSVLYKDDIYALYYHGSAPRNNSTDNPSAPGWEWFKECNVYNQNGENIPVPGHYECNDRVFFAWKHLSCAAGGACGTNNLWNFYPFQGNYPGIQYSFPPGPTTGLTTLLRWNTGNGLAQPYLPHNLPGQPPRTTYAGAGYPNVIYARGKYFGVFDVIVGGNYEPGQCPGEDLHRMVWGYSTNGVNWTFTGLIYRDMSEVDSLCQGAVGQQLFFEEQTNTFYLAFLSLKNSQLYLMRATYSSSPPYYQQWQLPNLNWTAWNPVPNYRDTPSQPVVDLGNVATLIDPIQTCGAYSPQLGFAKVYRSNAPGETQYRWILLMDLSRRNTPCNDADPNYPLRLYSSTTLTKTHNTYTEITAARNLSHTHYPSEYGWMPQFVWVTPNAQYLRQYNPVTIYVNYNNEVPGGNNKDIGRIQLSLSGEIFP